MDNKNAFGELSSNDFIVGDIVEWSRWNSENEAYDPHYGILIELKDRVISNRIISIAKVVSLGDGKLEREFFTLGLRLISRNQPVAPLQVGAKKRDANEF
jgi:hypothetical protein|tara:strand:- start:145 stop:444 length:300 start_codon:yes stop_codon:yes gene_type:complete